TSYQDRIGVFVLRDRGFELLINTSNIEYDPFMSANYIYVHAANTIRKQAGHDVFWVTRHDPDPGPDAPMERVLTLPYMYSANSPETADQGYADALTPSIFCDSIIYLSRHHPGINESLPSHH